MTSKQKTSSVWPFFCEDVGTPFATCTLCSSRIKRGKDGDLYGPTYVSPTFHIAVETESDSLIFKSIFVFASEKSSLQVLNICNGYNCLY